MLPKLQIQKCKAAVDQNQIHPNSGDQELS